MRVLVSMLVVLALGVFTLQAQAAEPETEEEDYPTCYVTHKRCDTSSTWVKAVFMVDAQKCKADFLNLTYMLYAYEALYKEGFNIDILQVQILDYSTFGTDDPQMLTLADDEANIWFVLSEDKLDGSAAPYLAAFPSEEAAREALASKTLVGDVLSWDKAIEKLMAVMQSDEKREAEENSPMGPYY